MIVASSVKRVISCFILSIRKDESTTATRDRLRIAVFQRKSTMPTFPSHWAGVSGSIEEGEEPWQTAVRELQEETNLIPNNHNNNNNVGRDDGIPCTISPQGGLYLDVPFQPNRSIRVYPFVVRYSNTEEESHQPQLELRGTEHDTHRWISIAELEELEPAVPGLAAAFHRATFGRYRDPSVLPQSAWEWAEDRVNGATTLARNAIQLAMNEPLTPEQLAIMATLRPTMVPIVNVLKALQEKLEQGENVQQAGERILSSLDEQVERSIQLGVASLQAIYDHAQSEQVCSIQSTPFTIATFSRSSTILKLLQRFYTNSKNDTINLRILCAKSTPGDEGEFMAEDLLKLISHVECIDDEAVHQAIRSNQVHAVLVGSDCVMNDRIVNKIGTKALAETCQESDLCTLLCCADRWKVWDDVFPPPLEEIFECVPSNILDQVLVPEA